LREFFNHPQVQQLAGQLKSAGISAFSY